MRNAAVLFCAPWLLVAQTLAPEQLREDFRILRSALEEGHPGIYRYTPKPELDRAFERAVSRLNRPMSALEFFRVVSPAVGALRCGHTAVSLPADMEQHVRESVLLIPLEVRILNGRIFVLRDYSEPALLQGAEIHSINGRSAKQILEPMLRSIRGDGDSATAGPWRIGHSEFAKALYTLADIESPFRIGYSLNDRTATTRLEGVTDRRRREIAASRRPPHAATYRFNEDAGSGVLTIYQFGGTAEDGKPLSDFIQKSFDDLHERRGANLILDVRNNGGGADEVGKQLFSYLTTEPFPYYADLVINKLVFDFFRYADHPRPIPESMVARRPNGKYLLTSHPNWGIQQPGKPHFSGRVFVLMNGGSFSTTCEFLSTLHHHRRATFIGEEAAGGYYGNTSGPGALLVLPNSRLRLPVRLMTYHMAIPGSTFKNGSIPPDYPSTYSIQELLAGKDKEMDIALQLISAGRKTAR